MQPDSNPDRPRLFLIDGYALIYRAFFAMIGRPLLSSRGENTSAAFGVTRFLLKVFEQHAPPYLGVVFDAGSSERHEIFPEYKATREKMPTELESSIPRVQAVIEGFRVPVIHLDGYEADDVIGTLALEAAARAMEAVIVSGDKDFHQLVRPGVSLLNPGRGGPAAVEEEWVTPANARDRLGVAPEHVTDYLALIGDASDNVPGVAGIGPKTAIKLIEQFGTIEKILARLDEVTPAKAQNALREHQEAALLSKRLVTIRTDLPVQLDLDALRRGEPDRARLRELFLELEFNTLARTFGGPDPAARAPEAAGAAGPDYQLVQEVDGVNELVRRIREAGRVSVDTETSSIDPLRGELAGVSLCIEPGEAFYLPFRHRKPQTLLETGGEVTNLPPITEREMEPLVGLLENPRIRKIGQNLKYDLLVFRRAGVHLRGLDFDTMIAAYLLDPGARELSLDTLAMKYLDHRTITYAEVAGKGRNQIPFAEVPLDRARDYAAEDAEVALRLAEQFAPELERLKLESLFRTIEMPLVEVLADMEWAGIRIDERQFAAASKQLIAERDRLEAQIYEEAGAPFNIGSPTQLREVLFDRLELPILKRTKTGASTDAEVLTELAARGHRLPELLLTYRQLDKLQTTYLEALPKLVNPETGRIHTSFNQTVASTGRLSSSDPNLQNIPIRTAMGAEIRRMFVPAEGYQLMSADYSQIELRILAHYSEDPAFLTAFRQGEDIHRQTAALIFGVPLEQVTREMRGRAKTVNFAVIYGIGPHSLAARLAISMREAREFIDRYFERFPGVRRYLDTQIELAREQGYVETLTGRRRYIPEIRDKNWNVRAFGERAATNAPIQGSSADIIKIAMIRIHKELAESGSGARMLLQVHDELLFEIPRDEVDDTLALVKPRMEGAAKLKVPLLVETGFGMNWLECK